MDSIKVKSLEDFKKRLNTDQQFKEKFIGDPFSVIMNTEKRNNPLAWDKWIYRLAVGGLIIIILAVIISVVIMYSQGKTGNFQVPDLFVAIGSGAIGAVAGLLTPTPTESKEE